MKLHLLWTDQCYLALLFVLLGILIWSLHKDANKILFKRVFANPIAAACAVILLSFLLISILDSITFINVTNHKVLSILDMILDPLGQVHEKTYSAPFALQMYTPEIQMKAGNAHEIFQRLAYPPLHLTAMQDVYNLIFKVFLSALLIAVCFYIIGFKLMKHKTKSSYAILLTTSSIIFFLIFSYALSRYIHIFGTGEVGQDIYYYALKSIRTGLVIGLLTTLFMMPLAIILGLSAGFFGGIIDDIVQYIYTTLSSIPGVLLISASVLSMQTYISAHREVFTSLTQSADARLLILCIILGVTSWTSLCRLLRAETLKLREMDYVKAAKTIGSSRIFILSKHILPNVFHIILITFILDFSFLVLAEAVLAYVGVGVSPMTISFGNMINSARLELAREPVVWWPITAAFSFMFVLVLASNLLSDAISDTLNKRQYF